MGGRQPKGPRANRIPWALVAPLRTKPSTGLLRPRVAISGLVQALGMSFQFKAGPLHALCNGDSGKRQ
jgi:hypothetical protein